MFTLPRRREERSDAAISTRDCFGRLSGSLAMTEKERLAVATAEGEEPEAGAQ